MNSSLGCIDLSKSGPGNFHRTRSKWLEAIWMVVEFLLVTNPLQVSSRLRVAALRLFGATIGRGVIMRPRIRVKFPWNLSVGDRCWIGEGVWIHNQTRVTIGHDVVISQETFITTGSHDTRRTMDLIVKPVTIRDGAWVTSRCIVLQGVEVGENTIITPGSVVHRSLKANGIYGGNPCTFIKPREIVTEDD
ncbi:MAG: WcaF family extracellular polysaccharide biosynthesis acetyltransferase [Alicyclobacillus sp.]|nr:WcaF family extracellular polysaccharide biosynthesis acetyltransferase [Alicyclobacillus sp.]